MDPLSWINAGSNLIGAVAGLQPKNGAPGIATSGGTNAIKTDVDFSGFTVATGKATADGAKINKTSSDGIGQPAATLAGALGNVSPVVILAVALAAGVIWRIVKK